LDTLLRRPLAQASLASARRIQPPKRITQKIKLIFQNLTDLCLLLAGLTHFSHWTTLRNIEVKSIDEKLIQQFLNDHLPCCNCEEPVLLRRQMKKIWLLSAGRYSSILPG